DRPGDATLHICRGPAAGNGRFPLYLSENSLVNHSVGNAAPLRRLNFPFRMSEIQAITAANIFPADHWKVNSTDHAYLGLMPDEPEINSPLTYIQGPNSPVSGARRATCVAAVQQFQNDMPHQGMDLQRQMRSEMRTQMILMTAVTSAV